MPFQANFEKPPVREVFVCRQPYTFVFPPKMLFYIFSTQTKFLHFNVQSYL